MTARMSGKLAIVSLQVAVAVYLLHLFRIEDHAFADRVVPLAALGFLPHHFAPARWRLGIVVGLALTAIALIFGLAGIWLIGIVLVMIAACHLPIGFRWRVAVVIGLAGVMAAMRLQLLPTPWPAAIWPIVASILMFRLIGYLYDLRYQQTAPGVGHTLAYFFLLPNVAFTLFPVIDFATFKRTYYDREPTLIYEEGVQWILRGVFQLVLYRLVYQYGVIPPTEVVSSGSLVRYLLANFGLYLRVSGSFHLAVGLLHLYGFRLPETHRLFYLASSFTDFWRRINIYWKEFMQKLVFSPIYYPMRRRVGDTHALTLATLGVFAATWVFHSYQWFWILGRWTWSVTDTLFWGILAVALVVNSQREARRGRTRTVNRAATRAPGARDALVLAINTAATFTVICVLWGLWTSPTLQEFVGLFSVVRLRPTDIALLLAAPVAIGVAAIGFDRLLPRFAKGPGSRPGVRFAIALAPVLVLAVLTDPRIAGAMGSSGHRMALAMRSNRLNRQDSGTLQRGYYEQIMEVDRFNGDLWRVYSERPTDWTTIEKAGARRSIHTFQKHELVPSHSVRFKGAQLTTNQYGMRDGEYAIAKPPFTWRIALIGKSHVLGEGVPDDSTFEAIAERQLNAARPSGAPKVEILNFAVSGLTPLQQAALMDGDRVRRFAPDVVLYIGHVTDVDAYTHLLVAVHDTIPIPYDSMRTLVATSGISRTASADKNQRAIIPFREDVIGWAYRHVSEAARQMGARPAWMYVPLPMDRADDIPIIERKARDAGFLMLSSPEMYLGHDENDLVLGSWDNHPNVAGHHIIADRLAAALQRNPVLLGRSPSAATGTQ